jgi:DMSO/TMAO reductase YedYZ molybdopterin-dependent catalytic subunit
VFGLVEKELSLTYDQVLLLPPKRIVVDIHCVTGWSKFDTVWEGAPFRTVAEMAGVLAEAGFVMFHSDPDYTTSVSLDTAMDNDVILAWRYGDLPLTPEHGYPLRSLVPKKYFWKSAKWLRGIEFMAKDRLGFWERNGYHNGADPWLEQRYS